MTNRRYERGLALILMLWLICCFKANAQVAVTPAPVPKLQFLSSTGAPLAGGKVCTFQAGTTTPLTTYSESTGSSANTNPITLDSGGFANIFLQSQAYKFIVYSSVGADSNCPNAGVQQYSVDGINPGALGNTAITGTLSLKGATSGTTVVQAMGVASGTLTLPAATDTLVGKNTTDTLTNKTLNQPLIVGVADASSAATGNLGEFVRTKQATPQALTSTVILSLGSISLTAGDWDIQANGIFSGNSTTVTAVLIGISTANNSIAPNDGSWENLAGSQLITSTAIAVGHGVTTNSYRVSINATTSYFLVAQATFGSGTVSVAGTIRARRVR